jgi:hypothetical protein
LGEGLLDQAADIAFLVKRRNDNGNTHGDYSFYRRGKWALPDPQ